MRIAFIPLCLLLCLGAWPARGLALDLPPMLAQRAPDDPDPAAYWVSEKLDGVRARWDGRILRFRNGEPVVVPDWFVAPLPAGVVLDGELWLGRRRFDELSGLVRRLRVDDARWRQVRYMLFELPGADGDFSARLHALQALAARIEAPWVEVVPQQRLVDRAALRTLYRQVLDGGGEGLVLHRADARWQPGRSPALLKLTPFLDEEAEVIAHVPGRGRLQGRLGALRVRDDQGRVFSVGSGFSDAQRMDPPAVGARITFRYRERTPRGVPRFPVFVRERSLP
ncbi:DNA ligase [Methyloversatilis thermotolerans]|uniref:DNA ligase n=1 Tax=Methyloversatilis thermotolerans TaxID=1346290 RepID=UPI000365B052|nr:DNA ligase [Methyloversatilis thermotolerans]